MTVVLQQDKETDSSRVKKERRKSSSDRRLDDSNRRSASERRYDRRLQEQGRRRSVKAFMRGVFNARLGVDRRKGQERRSNERRFQVLPSSLLTQDELKDLLC